MNFPETILVQLRVFSEQPYNSWGHSFSIKHCILNVCDAPKCIVEILMPNVMISGHGRL